MDKCFCHLNGLQVKDATARKELKDLKEKTDSKNIEFEQSIKDLNSSVASFQQSFDERVSYTEQMVDDNSSYAHNVLEPRIEELTGEMSIHKHSFSDINGICELAKGGTGANTPGGARKNLETAHAIESENDPGCYYRIVDGRTEWINPPMGIHTEYCTTERWMGKPVYTLLVAIDTLPNNTAWSQRYYSFFDENGTRLYKGDIIRACGGSRLFDYDDAISSGSDNIPRAYYVWDGSNVKTLRTVDLSVSEWQITISSNYDCSEQYGYVQIWYTKEPYRKQD